MFPQKVENFNTLYSFIQSKGFRVASHPTGTELLHVSLAFDPMAIPRREGDDIVYPFTLATQMLSREFDANSLRVANPDLKYNFKFHRGLRIGNQLKMAANELRENGPARRATINFTLESDTARVAPTLAFVHVMKIGDCVTVVGHFRSINVTSSMAFELIGLNFIAAAVAAELGLEVGPVVLHIDRAMIYDADKFFGNWTMGRMFVPKLRSVREFSLWAMEVNKNLVDGTLSRDKVDEVFFSEDPDNELTEADLVWDEVEAGAVDLESGISMLTNIQSIVSGMVPGCISHPPTNRQVVEAAYAMIEEVHELVRLVGWKSWKENPDVTPELVSKIVDEYADVLAFQGLLTHLIELRTGIQPDQLVRGYVNKTIKNMRRFAGESGEDGYIGAEKLAKMEYNNG